MEKCYEYWNASFGEKQDVRVVSTWRKKNSGFKWVFIMKYKADGMLEVVN